MTHVAALGYADHGIPVNVLAPGPILTHRLHAASEQAQRPAAQATPMRRVGRAEQVAAPVSERHDLFHADTHPPVQLRPAAAGPR